MAPERERGRISEFVHNPRKMIGTAAIGFVAAASYSVVVPPETVERSHGSEPIVDTTYAKIYPMRGADGGVEWPFYVRPWGYDTQQSAGQTFTPTKTEQESAIEAAEVRNTHEGEVTCPDGSKVPYSTFGALSLKELQSEVCDGASEPDDVAAIEAAGKGDVEAQKSANTPDKKDTGSDTKKSTTTKPSQKGNSGGSSSHGSKKSTPKKSAPKKKQPVGCMRFEKGARILCVAQKYEGIYYRFGAGHVSRKAFLNMCPNPERPGQNTAHGANRDWNNAGVSGNPSPCATDCSGLVSQAVNQAFHRNQIWNVAGLKNSSSWKKIQFKNAKPGDIVTQGGNEHVEIVRYRKGQFVYTFGSHATGTRTGKSVGRYGEGYDATYRYVGKS